MKLDYGARLAAIELLLAADRGADQLAPRARAAVGALWAHRAHAELTAAYIFAGLHEDCVLASEQPVLLELTQRAIEDERFHSRLSARVAEHYLRVAPPEPAPVADALRFESCEAEVARGLRLLLHCALNETIAAAYLRECQREAASALMQAALRELLRDEVDHARIGWAYLASLDGATTIRERLCHELPSLLSLVTSAWHKPLLEDEYPSGHGALTLERTRLVTRSALETLVLPGLAQFGISHPELSRVPSA